MEIYKKIAEKFGVTEEIANKIESGELEADAYFNEYTTNFEQNAKSRFAKEIEQKVTSDVFGKAYGKTEKQLQEVFGLNEEDFKEVAKNERFGKMLEKVKELHSTKLSELSSADQNKYKQIADQLELSNAEIKRIKAEYETKIEGIHAENALKDKNRKVGRQQTELMTSLKNPRNSVKTMRAVLQMEMNERGYDTEIDDDGRIWITKNGARVAHPTKRTENLDYSGFFEIVSQEHTFEAQSKGGKNGFGGNGGGDDVPKSVMDKLPAAFKEFMKE